jgi:hypothetical protein
MAHVLFCQARPMHTVAHRACNVSSTEARATLARFVDPALLLVEALLPSSPRKWRLFQPVDQRREIIGISV